MLIGICGNKGVGKNTAADFLDGYTQMAFADKLKEAVANLFGMDISEVDFLKNQLATVEVRVPKDDLRFAYSRHLLYWREFLQRFGTEMGRNTFGESFWADKWASQYDELSYSDPAAAKKVVVTDVRFHNEASRIIWHGGHIIEIIRPDCEPDGHASEDGIPDDLIDATVYNDGTVDDFKRKFLAVVEGLSVGVVSG